MERNRIHFIRLNGKSESKVASSFRVLIVIPYQRIHFHICHFTVFHGITAEYLFKLKPDLFQYPAECRIVRIWFGKNPDNISIFKYIITYLPPNPMCPLFSIRVNVRLIPSYGLYLYWPQNRWVRYMSHPYFC